MEMDSILPPEVSSNENDEEKKIEDVVEPEVEGLPTPTPRLMITKMVSDYNMSFSPS